MRSIQDIKLIEEKLAGVSTERVIHICSAGWIQRMPEGNYAVRVCRHVDIFGARGALLYHGRLRHEHPEGTHLQSKCLQPDRIFPEACTSRALANKMKKNKNNAVTQCLRT